MPHSEPDVYRAKSGRVLIRQGNNRITLDPLQAAKVARCLLDSVIIDLRKEGQ